MTREIHLVVMNAELLPEVHLFTKSCELYTVKVGNKEFVAEST